MSGRHGRRSRLGALALVGILAATACGTNTDEEPVTLEVFGPYGGIEADRMAEVLGRYADTAGVEIRYTGSTSFVIDLQRRLGDSADPPDIAIVPQPGVISSLVDDGYVVPVSVATIDALDANYDEAGRALARFDDRDFAVPFRRTLKSVVWYRPDVFDVEGWNVPTTLDGVSDLSTTIQSSERAISPWCFAIDAGASTGWAVTDWIEDLLLRRHGPDFYADWVSGGEQFGSPEVEAAFDEFRQLVLAPGAVEGGITAVLTTPVDRGWEPLLAPEAGCAMYKQADFALDWMPAGTTVGPDGDVDWFLLPGSDEDSPPLVVGGDSIVQFDDRPEVVDLMTFLAGPTAGVEWARHGGFLSAKSTIEADEYPEVERRFVEALTSADIVFDGSDQMASDIGSDLFWSLGAQWTSGGLDYEGLATTLDDARDEAES